MNAAESVDTRPAPTSRSVPVVGLLLVAATLAGCVTPQPAPVSVGGRPDAVASLVGHWRGEYSNATTGRSGVIAFHLEAGGEVATGTVTMIADRRDAASRIRHPEDTEPTQTPLNIRLVQIDAGGNVAGALEPYRDPGCSCMLSTSFTGTIDGDRITGHFIANGGRGHMPTRGRWRVDRTRAP